MASAIRTARTFSFTSCTRTWEQPESTNPYMKGDKVTHAGRTWVSTIDNNVWPPSGYPDGWTDLGTIQEVQG